MNARQIVGIVFGYVFMGFTVELMSLTLVLDEAEWCPSKGKPALGFAFGALWPLSIVAGVCYALWLSGGALGRRLAALHRAWRPARVAMPKATAKRPVRTRR